MNSLLSVSRNLFPSSRRIFSASKMGSKNLGLVQNRNHVNYRMVNVCGYKTDLLEIHSENPKLHVLFIPGNPGVVSFYDDFLDSLYKLLGGTASVTAIGHISHSEKSAEPWRLFSLQEQIDHKISFMKQEYEDCDVPIALVGHSIGSHISLELFKRSQAKVIYCLCLYPFLTVNTVSSTQSAIRKIAASPAICVAVSSIGALCGMFPSQISRFLISKSIGRLWSSSAVQAMCSHVLQYHTIGNMLFMARTEFETLPEKPDWDFLREKKSQIAFLFGLDDHWGPLHLYEKICKEVPDMAVAVEREGHTHAFSCTEAGSTWAAQHVSTLIKNYLARTESTY